MASHDQRPEAQRKANARLGWILMSAALLFGLGFVAKVWLLAH